MGKKYAIAGTFVHQDHPGGEEETFFTIRDCDDLNDVIREALEMKSGRILVIEKEIQITEELKKALEAQRDLEVADHNTKNAKKTLEGLSEETKTGLLKLGIS